MSEVRHYFLVAEGMSSELILCDNIKVVSPRIIVVREAESQSIHESITMLASRLN